MTPGGNWEGRTVLRRVDRAGLARRGGRSRRLARAAVRAARDARQAGARRQGARRLERPRHLGARPRLRRLRCAGVSRGGARRLRFRCRQSAWRERAPRPRLASRAGERRWHARRLCRDGARGDRALRGDRRAGLSRCRRSLVPRGARPFRRRRRAASSSPPATPPTFPAPVRVTPTTTRRRRGRA